MKSCAVAIVGHVDHGKTALVRALTGQETDRLKEEKARGLSITLGFAHRAYDAGIVDFIDSPGHEDFIRAMVCGSTGAQAALVVISSVEGVAQQTREHLEILSHLNVRRGIVALSKSDLVPDAERPDVRASIADALKGSPFAEEPFVFCSAETGEGLDELSSEIETLFDRAPQATTLSGAFLPIDRVFTLKGVGTVATGTLLGAPLNVSDEVILEPQGAAVTVRHMQAHNDTVDVARPGTRTAVNLRGVDRDMLHRGNVICSPGTMQSSFEIDAWVTLSSEQSGLKNGAEVRLLIGTASLVATVFVWGGQKSIEAGGGYVRLRFRDRVAMHAKQRGVLRRLSPATTLGGVTVLDPAPPQIPKRDPARLSVLQAAYKNDPNEIAIALTETDQGIASVSDIKKLSGITNDDREQLELAEFESVGQGLVAQKRTVDAARSAFLESVSARLAANPSRASVPVAEVKQDLASRFAESLLGFVSQSLLRSGALAGSDNALVLPGRDPFSDLSTARRQRLAGIERALRDGGTTPPPVSELEGDGGRDSDLVKLLVAADRAKFLRSTSQKHIPLIHSDVIDEAYDALSAAFPSPREFTTSEAREVLQTTRKFAIPLLEHFDKLGLTYRDGNNRRIVPRKV
ncbi:MAG: selenocysteine-specific translation elongation factor [Pseudomonadota bacterium]